MSHEILHKKLLASEIILIIASVFIFRSLWHLLDTIPFFNKVPVLIFTFVIGFLIAIPVWRYVLNKHH